MFYVRRRANSVSHLRRSDFLNFFPTLPGGAKLCRAYGASDYADREWRFRGSAAANRGFSVAPSRLQGQAHGIGKIAKSAGVERESLYRTLSANGNPRLSTLHAVAKGIGLKAEA